MNNGKQGKAKKGEGNKKKEKGAEKKQAKAAKAATEEREESSNGKDVSVQQAESKETILGLNVENNGKSSGVATDSQISFLTSDETQARDRDSQISFLTGSDSGFLGSQDSQKSSGSIRVRGGRASQRDNQPLAKRSRES